MLRKVGDREKRGGSKFSLPVSLCVLGGGRGCVCELRSLSY